MLDVFLWEQIVGRFRSCHFAFADKKIRPSRRPPERHHGQLGCHGHPQLVHSGPLGNHDRETARSILTEGDASKHGQSSCRFIFITSFMKLSISSLMRRSSVAATCCIHHITHGQMALFHKGPFACTHDKPNPTSVTRHISASLAGNGYEPTPADWPITGNEPCRHGRCSKIRITHI